MNEVPYFVSSELPFNEVSRFIAYVMKRNSMNDSINTVVIENPEQATINHISLCITSADVDKYVGIRGSNDERQWYVVKAKEEVGHLVVRRDGIDYLMLNFPEGNYAYYEFTLTNSGKSPLNILKAGTFEHDGVYTPQTKINLATFIRKDSTDQKTYIYFPSTEYNYKINSLVFTIANPMDYQRDVSVKGAHRHRFELSSHKTNRILFDPFVLSSDTVVIENNDNPPLQIQSVEAYGLTISLFAYLEKEQTYTLIVDERNTSVPRYDIGYFRNDIPRNIPVVKTTALTKTSFSPDVRKQMLIEKPLFLWGTITAIGLLLVLLCYKLLVDLKRRKI
jgi:hypothetical protein